MTATPASDRGLLCWVRKTLPFLAPHRWSLTAITLLTLVVAALDAVEPLLLKFLFDGLTGDEPMSVLKLAVAGLVGLFITRQTLGWVQNYLTWHTRIGIHYGMQRAVVDRVYSLPLAYHQQESVGSLTTRMDRGVGGVVGAMWAIVAGTVPSLIYLAIALTTMFVLEWRLFLLVLAFTPLPVLVGAWAAREKTQRERMLLDRWRKIYARLHEVLAGMTTVKSFARETTERRRFMRGVNETNRIVIRGVARDTSVGALNHLISTAARISAVAFGGYLVIQGETTIGTVIAFYGYISGLFGPVQGLTGIYQTLRAASVALETTFEILDAPDPLQDRHTARPLAQVRGAVEFENVDFAYRPDDPVIRGVSLRVAPGETVALVGPSGAGKTTLMALLQRFYDPTSGAILIDGMDLRTIRQKSLRRNIGVVLQDNLLFNDSIRNNIAYGRPEASLEEIETAARAANAYDFIMALPQGFDTAVGERGSHLSTGQRQRIAIARALVKDPPILILDEATSALDTESEALVQEALERLSRGRTTFVIAHRLSTVVNANRIALIKHGRITEIGSHEELMHARGDYASLVQRQTRGLLIPDLFPAERSVAASGSGASSEETQERPLRS